MFMSVNTVWQNVNLIEVTQCSFRWCLPKHLPHPWETSIWAWSCCASQCHVHCFEPKQTHLISEFQLSADHFCPPCSFEQPPLGSLPDPLTGGPPLLTKPNCLMMSGHKLSAGSDSPPRAYRSLCHSCHGASFHSGAGRLRLAVRNHRWKSNNSW